MVLSKPHYYVIKVRGRFISSRQAIFRPMQYTDKLKNAAKFNNAMTATGYANVNTHGQGVIYLVYKGTTKLHRMN